MSEYNLLRMYQAEVTVTSKSRFERGGCRHVVPGNGALATINTLLSESYITFICLYYFHADMGSVGDSCERNGKSPTCRYIRPVRTIVPRKGRSSQGYVAPFCYICHDDPQNFMLRSSRSRPLAPLEQVVPRGSPPWSCLPVLAM